ncbi:MAG: cation-translocating P-type ATPase [Actinomycetota bacterium]
MVDADRGLSAADVTEREARGQVNLVPRSHTRTVTQIVRSNVFTRFNALLGAMLAVILVVGPFQDALFGFVLVVNAGVGIVQELRAKWTLDRLSVLTAPKAHVVREGQISDVPVDNVVLDDVLELSAGMQVVVDGEVLVSDGLELDESLLTGESESVPKRPGEQALSGSFVAAGAGRMVATAVGADAYAVKLALEARRFTLTRSELRDGVDQILRWVTIAIVPTAALLFVSQLRHHDSWRKAVSGAVAGTVAMVPEGLVLLMSVAFAVAVLRLARRNVLVQELPAVEGLARVDVLCIDKTGTLTAGKLAVISVESLDRDVQVEEALAAIAAADEHPNATMAAIHERYPTVSSSWSQTASVPFSSARKWSAVAFGDKGSWLVGGADVLIGPEDAASGRAADAAAEGARVLVVARADGMPQDGRLPQSIRPAALVMLKDTLRPDAARTLGYFRDQDVTVKVISGDDPRTVGAIAEQLGLEGADRPIDARDLPDDEEVLADVMERSSVFGRVTPRQKRAMVNALRSRGHVVAMTGDGVNDALALKDADIGIAMGSGSDATRAVAQLVLLDSNFAALPQVVAEGRRVLGNIERTSGLYITKTVYAMLLSLAVGVAGFAFPFLPRHLTLIGALTIGIPSFFLALAPNTDRFKPGFVSRVARFALPAGALAAIATFLAYAIVQRQAGVSLIQARTAAVMVLTWIGLLVLSIIAAPLNRARFLLIWSMAGLFLVAVMLPATQKFFALESPDDVVWLAAIGIAAIVWSFARLFVPGEQPVGPRALKE